MIRIVKLGGSLLDWPLFPRELRRWLAAQTTALNVLVVGGGELAEAVRRLDEIHHLSPRDAHWLAAETMQITAKFVASRLPESLGTKRFDELMVVSAAEGVVIFDAWQFLCEVEPTLPGERLPESWDTTSDSIAARLAVAVDAEELVLLKSALPRWASGSATIHALAAEGYVDAALPRIAPELRRLRCVNLRDGGFAEWEITTEAQRTRRDPRIE
jgi:aspartokinase-like uncharacterized kinase